MTAKLTRMTEEEARAYLEGIRWPDGPVCPKCGSADTKRMGGKAGLKGQIKCRAKVCRSNFTVRVGSIFEDSKIPLRDWVYAFARMCDSKKGISAHQLHRELEVTYKTAWFICHRVRETMKSGNAIDLSGNVEADEAYVGGKPRFKGQSKRGRRTNKAPVAVLVERSGRARLEAVPNVTAKTVGAFTRGHVRNPATIHTDELGVHRGIGIGFDGGHTVVTHSNGEYATLDGASTNTAESFFAIMKRGLYGTFHHVSRRHLQRYCDEFAFRWNERKATDAERVERALKGSEGVRLTYG